ncbi:hypothetical protein [Acinetobacter sp. ANC 4640]
MTVSNQTPYVEYTANGSTTNFALTFNCDNANNLIVKVNDVESIGTWTLQGTSIVFITAPIAGSIVSIERNTPLERSTDYQTYDDSFSPKPVNKDFDSIWWKLQELYYKLINKVSIKRKINTVGGLTGGGDLSSDLNISIENQYIEPKTYGSSIKIPVITVNEKGIITGISVADFAGGGGSTIQVGFEDILNLPTTLLGYGITDALNKNSNLNDLQNKLTARSNLNVYSTNEVDTAIAVKATTAVQGTIKTATTLQAKALTDTSNAITPSVLLDGVKAAFNADNAPPVYACRAWVNFNSVPLSGTYTQSGTTVTVTMTAHSMSVGMPVNLTTTSGTAISGNYLIATVIDANTFTYTAGTNLTTSGNIIRNLYVRASGNILSIIDNGGLGDYTINFIVPMPHVWYLVGGSMVDTLGGGATIKTIGSSITNAPLLKTTSAVRIGIGTGGSSFDCSDISINIIC